MKKQYSILSVMFALMLGLFISSCGQKRDEALVTEYNSKKTEADSLTQKMMNEGKMMMADHAAWSAKLDAAAKTGADTAKIAWFKGEMKKMEDHGKMGSSAIDSLKYYSDAKVETNDQLKAAIAGLNANLAICNTMCMGMMDAHKKLGADITAFLGGEKAETPKEEAVEHAKKVTKTTTTTTPPMDNGMDMSKHPVKPTPKGAAPRQGSGGNVK